MPKLTPKLAQPYIIQGHMAASGHKCKLTGCYYIHKKWYRPTVVSDYSGVIAYASNDGHEIGWDYKELPSDFVVDSFEEEKPE